MKKIVIPFAFLLLISAGACKKKAVMEEQTPSIEVDVPIVDSVTLHKTLPGVIRANRVIEVVARVNGRIVSKNYNSGDYVKAGQVLFTIESTKYNNAVQQAQATLDEARSNYEYYSKQYAAMKKALLADAVSQMDVNQAESNMKNAEASIRNAQAALTTARTNLGYCTVTAPASGHITSSTIDVGNVVTGEGSPVTLATIYDDTTVQAVFDISASQYESLLAAKGGTSGPMFRAVPLTFEVDIPGNYTADLVYTSPSVSETTGSLTLKGVINNPDSKLRDGMFVSVSLPYDVEPHAILVRDASIGTDQLGKYLYVVNDSDKVVYTPVEVGEIYQDTLRVITKGINDKSRYVTKALLSVRNGETVKPVMPAGKKAAEASSK